MRSMLDREMPEKRRRLFGWWWFSLLLLPLVVYGGWHWLKSNPNPIQNPKSVTKSVIAQNAAPIPTNSLAAPETALTVENKVSAPLEKGSSTIASNVSSGYTKQLDQVIATSSAQPKQVFQPLALVSPEAEEIVSKPIATAEPELRSNPLSLLRLPITTQNIDYQNKNNKRPHLFSSAEPSKAIKKVPAPHWAFGATTAISADQPQRINGFSTGLTVDYKFNRKWGLRSGLLYNLYTPQEKNKPVASVQSDDYTSSVEGKVIVFDFITGQQLASNSNQDFYNDSLSGNVFIPVNRLQRLEIPINAFWQVARPLKLIGGFSLTRTLAAKSDQQNYTDEYIIKLADQTSNDGASKLSSSELGNWSADALLGFGLKMGRSFELGLTAKLPLNKISGLVKADENATMGASSMRESIGSTKKQSNPFLSLYGTLFF